MKKPEISRFYPQSPVLISLCRHQCDHVTIVIVSKKLLILSIFSASLRHNNALYANGSILFYPYVF